MPGLFDGTSLERPVTCETCGKPHATCTCPRNAKGKVCLPKDQSPRVHRERLRGKWVTVITGLDPTATDLKALAKRLRSTCSAGGSASDECVEVQGDHRDRIVQILLEQGYAVKAAGG